jgi:hypothetical protein
VLKLRAALIYKDRDIPKLKFGFTTAARRLLKKAYIQSAGGIQLHNPRI